MVAKIHKKINLLQFIIPICVVVITASLYYYLVIYLPQYQNKKLEFSKKICKEKNIKNNDWAKDEFTKDLNGDGINEWLVIDGPHGSGGFISFNLFSEIDYQPTKIFSSEVFYQGRIDIIDNKIRLQFGFPREGDPNCCPSRTKVRTYIYKNEKVNLKSEKLIENKI